MDNVVLTSATQISPSGGCPLNTDVVLPAASANVTTEENLSAPVSTETNVVDGNVQAHLDFNYQAHDVALAAATATAAPPTEKTNGIKTSSIEHHQMEIDDGYEHPDKSKSCCSMLNKLFLALAIVCFALFLCSIAFIVANLDGLNGKTIERNLVGMSSFPYHCFEPFHVNSQLLDEPYFNITHPYRDGMIVVLARRGASIHDILVPERNENGDIKYRSIVLRGNDENHFGSIRFGFDDEMTSMNMTNQLPNDYPYFNAYNQNWSLYADRTRPYRARFVNDLMEVIYEISRSDTTELVMTTIVSAPIHQQIVADPTNNIYFNLRGYGDLSTHRFNISSATAINLKTYEKSDLTQIVSDRPIDQLNNLPNYFYKFDRAGLGKNFVGTLSEREKGMNVHLFSDHVGLVIDPSGFTRSDTSANFSEIRGIRLSPRQTPSFQSRSIFGPSFVVYPSQLIHTTWWQFDFDS